MDKSLRVLLVEDSQHDAELIIRALRLGGYAVVYERVQTADAMRAALTGSTWDLVLSDYSLPSFSAPAALEVLNATGIDLPFLIISGTIGEETAVTALKAGAHDFLVKGRLARLIPAVERELRDVTERRDKRRAEEALRVSEAQHRSLVEHAVFGIYQATVDGRLLAVNPALVRMLGYDSSDDLLKGGLSNVYVDAAARADLVRRCLDEGHVAGAELIWRRKTGDEIRVRLSGRLRADRYAGGPVFQVFVEDITEHHRLQDQLRQAQKMEAVGQLAGGVAHDFNNMLTAILGYAELLSEQIGPDKPVGRDVREIQAAAERAAALTRQLLAFSRKQVLALAPLDLSEVVRNLEPMLRRLISGPIKIDTRLADHLSPVLGDATQLEHLLVNLAVNARDAMSAGGGLLTIATGDVTLDDAFVAAHRGARVGSHAMLSVTDTGTGMSPEVLERIFEPFFTTKERGRGTGLGLAAVYGTVKQMNGYIAAESDPGRGSTFTVYLPVTNRPVSQTTVPLSVNSPPVGSETILLVEDEDGVRSFAKTTLRRFGYHIIEADSAENAMKLLEHFETPIHLLLTDVVLPGLDGRQLALQVTRHRPNTRVLFMSGYASTLSTVDGFLIPGAQLLEKPFTAQALLAKTRQILGAGIRTPNR